MGCRSDGDCPSKTACINGECIDPCGLEPCGENAECRVVDTVPVRTVACECLPGYQGDALDKCIPSRPPLCVGSEGGGDLGGRREGIIQEGVEMEGREMEGI